MQTRRKEKQPHASLHPQQPFWRPMAGRRPTAPSPLDWGLLCSARKELAAGPHTPSCSRLCRVCVCVCVCVCAMASPGGPSLTKEAVAGGQEKPLAVRSVLLRWDHPHPRQQRRRQAHQVRFKDLVEGSSSEESPPHHHHPRASGPQERQSWPQAKPSLPAPPKRCATIALQDPHGLQQPMGASPFFNQSHKAGDTLEVLGQQDPPSQAHTSPYSFTRPLLGSSLPANLCPPPPRPSPPYVERAPCLPAGCASSQQEPPMAPPQLLPCSLRDCSSSSLRPKPPCLVLSPLLPPAPLSRAPVPREQQPGGIEAPRPSCQASSWDQTGPRAPAPLPHTEPWVPWVSPQNLTPPLLTSPPISTAHYTPSSGGHDLLPPEEVRQAQGLGKDLPASGEKSDLQARLQSLETLLESSQRTIQALLGIIQDLEKKEAQRDGRKSYQTGQDLVHCGTCQYCACIVYSVERDFRQQEGCFQQLLKTTGVERSQSLPTVGRSATLSHHRHVLPPVSRQPARDEPKKSRWKCFGFL